MYTAPIDLKPTSEVAPCFVAPLESRRQPKMNALSISEDRASVVVHFACSRASGSDQHKTEHVTEETTNGQNEHERFFSCTNIDIHLRNLPTSRSFKSHLHRPSGASRSLTTTENHRSFQKVNLAPRGSNSNLPLRRLFRPMCFFTFRL